MSREATQPLPFSYAQGDGWVRTGRVTECRALSLVVRIWGACPGHVIEIDAGPTAIHAEVCEVRGEEAVCVPIERPDQVRVGATARCDGARLGAYCGPGLLGRCVDAWGRGADEAACQVQSRTPRPLALSERRRVSAKLTTGIAAIDALCTIGKGQRIALFSGAGVGKSTLLRRIAEHALLDAHVVALIGERGREAAEAAAELRSSPAWDTTTLVCATADASPRERFAAATTALAQAEWLCDRGMDVLLTVDSLTRVANAWRETALATGEPAAHRGYPASMVGALASLVERAGARPTGSITGIFAVLVDGDDPFEPVTDTVRGLLDGHIVLSRRLSEAGRYPPIDALRSSSRLMRSLVPAAHAADAALVRKALAALERAEDLFAIGAYRPGGDPELDAAVAQRSRIDDFLFQAETTSAQSLDQLSDIGTSLRVAPRCGDGVRDTGGHNRRGA